MAPPPPTLTASLMAQMLAEAVEARTPRRSEAEVCDMPECRGCGVALAPHELELCEACWDARERDDDEIPNLTAERLHRYGGEYHGG